ncbi:MAG: TIGR03790 family protein, partial [Thermoplasmata archaeon]
MGLKNYLIFTTIILFSLVLPVTPITAAFCNGELNEVSINSIVEITNYSTPVINPDHDSFDERPSHPAELRSRGLYNGLINYSDVLLIVNDDSPISTDIGTYFAQQRSLPRINICNVTTSTAETINAATFADLRTQIENHINTNDLKMKINYMVTTKGVPLRVDYGGGSRASVDSDLSFILGKYSGWIGQSGPENNPYNDDMTRFSKEEYDYYLVTRLTGYTAEEAKGLVDLATESYGKRGMFFLDVSPAKDGSGYQVGNDWMRQAYTKLNAKGVNVTKDETNTFITDVQNVSGYTSWGSNDGAYSTNHVTNTNLETDSDGNGIPNSWYLQREAGDNWSRNDTDVYSQSWSMKLERPTVTTGFSALSQNITVQPGVRYYLAGVVNLTNMSATGKGAFLQIAARDGNDNIIKYYNGSARRSTTNSWVGLSQIHYEPIDGVTKITISIVVSECSGTVMMDLIRLFEIKPHNTYIPGAIAETYVSTGGRSFRYPTNYGQSLIADLIREGVTGVKGYVYEPYLQACAHPDILFDAYTEGYNLAESFYMASSWVSWMDIVIGDPKVAPYIDELAELTATELDLDFSTDQPSEGDEVVLTGTIHNTGKRSADNFKVQFYVGNPDDGGIALGATKSISAESYNFSTIEYTWDTKGLHGWYDIYLEFDLDDVILEQNESNNIIHRPIYINYRPDVLDILVPTPELLRNQTLKIITNGYDNETSEDQLICIAEIRHEVDESANIWESLPPFTYDSQSWTLNYTVNTTARLGLYDLRIRFSDNNTPDHPGLSDWEYRYDIFSVSNNNPVIISMELSKTEIFRTESVTITLKANDVETDLVNMTCELDVQFPGSSLWEKLGSATYLDGIWQMDFVPARDYPIGMYSFSASAYDGDIVNGKSPPLTLTDILKVKNNPGRVTNISVEDLEVFRLHNIDIMIEAEDVENPEVSLIGTVEYRHNGTQPSDWKDLSTLSYQYEGAEGYWITVFRPEKNAELGMYDFRASFEDLDGESEGWVYYNRAVKV